MTSLDGDGAVGVCGETGGYGTGEDPVDAGEPSALENDSMRSVRLLDQDVCGVA